MIHHPLTQSCLELGKTKFDPVLDQPFLQIIQILPLTTNILFLNCWMIAPLFKLLSFHNYNRITFIFKICSPNIKLYATYFNTL